jgi:hypothetical protein
MIADPIRDPASTAAANALHEALLRAAGRLPDEVVAECRAWLAEGLYVLADDHLVEIMHRMQLALTELGDRSPQVEVFANAGSRPAAVPHRGTRVRRAGLGRRSSSARPGRPASRRAGLDESKRLR